MFFPMFPFPMIPNDNPKPPTIYALLNSIVNFGKEEKTKIKNLASAGRTTIFDFDYPLSTHVSKEDFETQILNHYMMRRIGFDTLTAFQLQLNSKLNEIMPMYNKLFDAIEDWNIFNDGEVVSRLITDNGQTSLTNTTNSSNNDTSDRRYSDLPQNQIKNVKDGSYITQYNFDTNLSSGNSSSNSSGNDSRTTNETISRTPSDKMNIYKNFIESKNNIMTMIYKDLDSLFYGII